MPPHFHFQSQSTRYHLENARRLAEASKIAYFPSTMIQRYLKRKWGMDSFRFLNALDTQAFVASNEEAIFIAFRGTEYANFQDWIVDLKVKRVRHPWGSVHTGFKEALDLVWDFVLEALEEFAAPHKTIWLTGHSLGGALATLATDRLLQADIEPHGLYTFGQPRVGNKTYAKKFNQLFRHRTFRFANNNDIVARLPPRLAGYSHIGRSFYFDRFGKLHRDIGSWRRYLDQLAGSTSYTIERYVELRILLFDLVDDHGIQKYVNNLCKLTEDE